MQSIAKEHGGKCLSDTYVDSKTPLLWECEEKHRWKAIPSAVKNNGTWCQRCYNSRRGASQRLNIEMIQEIAKQLGGECLSYSYVNTHTNLLWECGEGHKWEARPSNVKSGTWCPMCAGNVKGTIEEMQEIAEERGGKCLSNTYIDSQTKLLWECSEGHKWEAKSNDVKNDGTWCYKCYNKLRGASQRLNIEMMQEIAKQRGGKCLSSTYMNTGTKLSWECAEGHEWPATPDTIKRGSWCPECSSGLGERICRVFFEQIFGKKFPKSYPKWLVSKEGNQMEIDGYCQSLALAFEHHGEQHYSLKTHFIKSEEDLRKRQEDDRLKREICTLQRIILIEVPEIPTRLSIDKVKAFIKKECDFNDIPLSTDFDTKKINLKKAYATSGARAAIKEVQRIAKKHGGKCLSDSYVNDNTNLLWECTEKHQWKATPSNIKRGKWCPECAGTVKGTIEEMRKIAEVQGGKCLSDTYINSQTKLLWECAKGHQWRTIPNNVKRGTWCPDCARFTRQAS